MTLLSRSPIPLRRRRVVLRQPAPAVIKIAETILRFSMPLFRGLPVPPRRFHIIPLHPFASGIETSESILSLCATLFGCFPVPLCCDLIILRHPPPGLVQPTDAVLGCRVTLFGGSSVPLCRDRIVLLHSLPQDIEIAKPKLGFRVALLGRSPVPLHGFLVILPNLIPRVVLPTETALSRWITRYRSQNVAIQDLFRRMKVLNQRHGKSQSCDPSQFTSKAHSPRCRHPSGSEYTPNAGARDLVQERDPWPEWKVFWVCPLRSEHAKQLPTTLDSSFLLQAQAGINRLQNRSREPPLAQFRG